MKIAMVSCSAFPFHNSGVAYVVHNTAKELIGMGHEVVVIGLSEEATTATYDGYDLIGMKLPGVSLNFNNTFKETDYNNPTGAKILEDILNQIKPDIVHFHSLNGLGANMVKKAKTLGYKTVITMHDWWWICPFSYMADNNHKACNQLKVNQDACTTCIQTPKASPDQDYITKRSAYLKEILKDDTDLIIPVSKYVESFLEPNGITGTKVITVPNGAEPIDNEGVRPTTPTTDLRNTAPRGTSTAPIIFGFLGGKHALKGHDLLIQAIQALETDAVTTTKERATATQDYQVHIYGTLPLGTTALKKVLTHLKSGNLKDLLGKIKRHLPNNKHAQDLLIIYHPLFKPEEKDQVYQNIDILLSLSKVKESSSLVVREALIRGIPVITTPSGGPEEVIKNTKSGIILKDTTANALQASMEQIITTSSLNSMEEYIRRNPYTYTTKDQAKLTTAAYERCFIHENRKNN